MTCLGGSGEDEDGFTVFVLNSCEIIILRGVQGLLTSRVRVQVCANISNDFHEISRILGIVRLFQFLSVFVLKHVERGKNESVEGVLANILGLPINELINVVWRGLEGKHEARELHIAKMRRELRVLLCDLIDGMETDGLISLARLLLRRETSGGDDVVVAFHLKWSGRNGIFCCRHVLNLDLGLVKHRHGCQRGGAGAETRRRERLRARRERGGAKEGREGQGRVRLERRHHCFFVDRTVEF
mmetsp:Transcript_25379/g.74709  ORF Transcript_25379/g.74709 Transcript_25379/m.74709 type:complete len:243 (-) Transcript_25379:117-845(-)